MFDVEDQEHFDSKELIINDDDELASDASIEERMKRKLQETLKNNTRVNGNEYNLDLLMILFAQDKNPDDNIFEGQYANYTIEEEFVSSNFFQPDTDNGSPQTINSLLEFTIMAKSCTGSSGGYFAGAENDEQFMMASYAAELVGMNMHNKAENIIIDPEIKQKMDQAWEQMKQDLNIENTQQVELSQDVTNENLIGLPMSLGIPKL